MSEDQRMRLKRLIEALAHATRISILDVLRSGEECVCEIEAQLGYRQAHISQHLAVLRKAGLLRDRRTGWNVFYHVVQPESIPCSTPHARCWLLTTDNTKRTAPYNLAESAQRVQTESERSRRSPDGPMCNPSDNSGCLAAQVAAAVDAIVWTTNAPVTVSESMLEAWHGFRDTTIHFHAR